MFPYSHVLYIDCKIPRIRSLIASTQLGSTFKTEQAEAAKTRKWIDIPTAYR